MASTITKGTPVSANSAASSNVCVAVLDETHFVIMYDDDGGDGYPHVKVGVITGDNTITFGSEYTIASESGYPMDITALDSTHFAVVYKGSDTHGHCKIGVVSNGDEVAFGSDYEFIASRIEDACIEKWTSTTFAVICWDYGTSGYAKGYVGTVANGDEISYGSQGAIVSLALSSMTLTKFDGEDKFLLTSKASGYCRQMVVSVSGTSISGSINNLVRNVTQESCCGVNLTGTDCIALLKTQSNNDSYLCTGTRSSTTITSRDNTVLVTSAAIAIEYMGVCRMDDTHFGLVFGNQYTLSVGQFTYNPSTYAWTEDTTATLFSQYSSAEAKTPIAPLGNGYDFVAVYRDETNSDNAYAVVARMDDLEVFGPANLKTFNGVAAANVKTIDGTAIASVKSINTIV